MKRIAQMMFSLAEANRDIMMAITMRFLSNPNIFHLFRYAQLVITIVPSNLLELRRVIRVFTF